MGRQKMPYVVGYNWVKRRELPWNKEKVLKNVKSVEGLRWRFVDAKGVILGRLASHLSRLLQGKDKPTYNPSKDDGDIVVVVNAKDIELTGRKFEDKVYRWHTGYPGGLKERTVKQQWEIDPTVVLRRAVSGMLPKNILRKRRLRKLQIFPGPDHDFKNIDFVPYSLPDTRKTRISTLEFTDDSDFEPLDRDWYEKMLALTRNARKQA